MSQHWYLVYSKPRQEARAQDHLERQGVSCFLPWMLQEKLIRGRKVNVKVPLFPRYLFVEMDPGIGGGCRSIEATRGVSHLVRVGQRLLEVPVSLVEQLKEVEAAHCDTANPLFKVNDRVLITEGPFQGLTAVYEAADGEERARLLLHLLGKAQSISLPLSSIRSL